MRSSHEYEDNEVEWRCAWCMDRYVATLSQAKKKPWLFRFCSWWCEMEYERDKRKKERPYRRRFEQQRRRDWKEVIDATETMSRQRRKVVMDAVARAVTLKIQLLDVRRLMQRRL